MKRDKKEKIFIETKDNHICEKCKKEILLNERCVNLITYRELQTNNIRENYWYHFQCWLDFFNDCVLNRLKAAQGKAAEIMKSNPLINKFMKNAGLLEL